MGKADSAIPCWWPDLGEGSIAVGIFEIGTRVDSFASASKTLDGPFVPWRSSERIQALVENRKQFVGLRRGIHSADKRAAVDCHGAVRCC